MAVACVVVWWFPQHLRMAELAVLSALLTIFFNALHSSQLTHAPKFLFSNERDKPENMIAEARARLRVSDPHQTSVRWAPLCSGLSTTSSVS